MGDRRRLKRLQLNKETLVRLTTTQLRRVVGGTEVPDGDKVLDVLTLDGEEPRVTNTRFPCCNSRACPTLDFCTDWCEP